MAFIKVKDGTQLYYKDWGKGKPVLFVHGWCLHSDSWEYMMNELCGNGFRCIAYDQRGCGRSDQSWEGYDIETLASDLAEVVQYLNLDDITLVGHSMGCAVICQYLATRQPSTVSRASLIGTTTPYVMKDESNPDGMDRQLWEMSVLYMKKDKPAYIRSLAESFFNLGENDQISADMVNWAVAITQSATLKAAIDMLGIAFFPDFRGLLPKINIPILIQHGEKDASSPVALTAKKSKCLLSNSKLIIYEKQAHGLQMSAWEPVSMDLISFITK